MMSTDTWCPNLRCLVTAGCPLQVQATEDRYKQQRAAANEAFLTELEQSQALYRDTLVSEEVRATRGGTCTRDPCPGRHETSCTCLTELRGP